MNLKQFLPVIALLSLSFASCKKSNTTTDSTSTTTPVLQATISGAIWTPDTVSATITYNATTKTKTFHFIGTKTQKQVEVTISDSNPADNQNFTGGSYIADAAGKNTFVYANQVKNNSGAYVFEPFGTVQPGNGIVNINAIDSTAKTISGSFNLNASKSNYDSDGNLISVDVAGVSSGSFTKLPYQQVRQ